VIVIVANEQYVDTIKILLLAKVSAVRDCALIYKDGRGGIEPSTRGFQLSLAPAYSPIKVRA
jgi:hypothetical protein